MIVTNYVPDPIEVPGNVTEERYAVRLAFIRRVTALHLLSVGAIVGLVLLPWPRIGWTNAAILLAIVFVLLDLVRIAKRGLPIEATFSAVSLPLVLLSIAWLICEMKRLDLPVWAPLTSVVSVFVYTVACRNDYSFVGCWVLSFIASNVAIAGLVDTSAHGSTYAAWALGMNGLFLTYHVYDLASLMSRRRKREEIAAVTDLYRDVFNFFGYLPRVIGHWRKHRIWAAGSR